MTDAITPPVPCPSCGAATTGKYCSDCGAPVRGALCAACRTILTPGARFCHRCGLAIGAIGESSPTASQSLPSGARLLVPTPARQPSQGGNFVPWSISALALIAVVAILAGQRLGSPDRGGSPQGDTQVPIADAQQEVVRAPDISSLSPRERADRLYDRMMRLASENKNDSVQFFAPMALSVYSSLGPLDLDLRYDLGRVAENSGNLSVAEAQADSILAKSPTHLLALILAGRVAALHGNNAKRDEFSRRLIQAEPAEMKKGLEEYTRHKSDIDVALSEAGARK
jgi:hypothetical protein